MAFHGAFARFGGRRGCVEGIRLYARMSGLPLTPLVVRTRPFPAVTSGANEASFKPRQGESRLREKCATRDPAQRCLPSECDRAPARCPREEAGEGLPPVKRMAPSRSSGQSVDFAANVRPSAVLRPTALDPHSPEHLSMPWPLIRFWNQDALRGNCRTSLCLRPPVITTPLAEDEGERWSFLRRRRRFRSLQHEIMTRGHTRESLILPRAEPSLLSAFTVLLPKRSRRFPGRGRSRSHSPGFPVA